MSVHEVVPLQDGATQNADDRIVFSSQELVIEKVHSVVCVIDFPHAESLLLHPHITAEHDALVATQPHRNLVAS